MFCCKSYVHVPIDKKSKSDTIAMQCIFGYDHDEFGYKLYDLLRKRSYEGLMRCV